MIQVKFIKDYKMMKAGETKMIEDLYATALLKRGVIENPNKKAKSEKE